MKVLGLVNAAAIPMISEATTIKAAAASTRMACRWAERVKAEATRSAMATTRSPAAALSELKPIFSTLGAKSSSMRFHSTVVDGLEPLSRYQAITGMLHSCNLKAGSNV